MTTLRALARAIGAASIVSSAAAQVPVESGQVDQRTAVIFANQVIDLVEARALRPRDERVYGDAKQRLLDAANSNASVERATLYRRTREMLWTLDTDGHTILWSAEQRMAFATSTPIERAAEASVVDFVATPDGVVMIVTPPAAGSLAETDGKTYATTLLGTLVERTADGRACALVIDLTKQTGGDAWTPLAVLGTLVTGANRSRLVDRDGVRVPLAPLAVVEGNRRRLLPPAAPDPLGRFRGTAIGLVIDSRTASAGETLTLMLMGEPEVRAFGRRTYGATTANVPVPIADDALLLLTTYRYAMGEEAPIRGAIEPDERIDAGDAKGRAAAWAAARSPSCGRPLAPGRLR